LFSRRFNRKNPEGGKVSQTGSKKSARPRKRYMEIQIKEILKAIGEDPTREGLVDTPSRFDKAFRYLTRGYEQDVGEILNDALFTVDYDEMVIVKDIDVFSLCEHHLMPFFGKAHVGYVPRGKVIGLSKIPRMVDVFARRLQVQERLTQQIAETIQQVIDPKGVAVVLECQHLCVMMRGVEKQNAKMVTSSMLGYFRKDQRSRNEFLNLIRANQ
jgi:GTP cyclohydrolase IA